MKKNYILIATTFLFLVLISQNMNAQCTHTVSNFSGYHEDFSSVTANNQLPQCWLSSNPSVTCLTYTSVASSGSYASFFDTPTGVSYFYSKGLYLVAGLTYSASLRHKVDNANGSNWTDLSIMYGTTQSAAGLVSIASTNGPANNANYTSLSNTFVVGSTGVYYMAIRGTSTSGVAHYLSWDNLAVTLPCSAGNNAPSMTLTANTSSYCTGTPYSALGFTATGADAYVWNTGATTPTITGTYSVFGYYEVIGTNTLTYCTASLSINIPAYPSPQLTAFVLGQSPTICKEDTVQVTAVGASSYSWTTGATSATISVSPSVTTTYSVVGTSTNGCSSSAAVLLSVNPLPVVTTISSKDTICNGEEITLTLGGATSYSFISAAGTNSVASEFTITPTSSSTYTVIGKNGAGCSNKTTLSLLVQECTGLNKNSLENRFSLYPNPTKGVFTISNSNFNGENLKLVVYTNLGQKIIEQTISHETTLLETNLSAGLYYYEVVNVNKKISTGRLIIE